MTEPIENHNEDIVEDKVENKKVAKDETKPPEIKESTDRLLPDNLEKKGTDKQLSKDFKEDQLDTDLDEKKDKERIEFEKYRKRREALDNEFELRSLAKRRTGSHLALIIGGILLLASFAAVLIFLNVISTQ